MLEFSTEGNIDCIKIFVVVAEPKLRQKFYISGISLVDLGRIIKEEPVCLIPTESVKSVVPCEPVIELPKDDNDNKNQAPSKVENLSNLLNAFHTYNKKNEVMNMKDTSLTPVVITSHAKELPLIENDEMDDDCYCEDWIEPLHDMNVITILV